MTLRKDVLEKRAQDELGALVRWSLRESVVGAAPSPQVWERIQERVERRSVLAQIWQSFASFLRVLVVWLSVDMYAPSFTTQPARRGEIVIWGYALSGARPWANITFI